MGFNVIERKPELALNSANGNDLLNYHHELQPEYDYYFQLFATAPYLQSNTIRNCVNHLISSEEYDSCFTATENHGFYWLNQNPINYRPCILPRSQDMLPVVEESTGLYGISKEALLKYRCRIGRKPYIHVISKFEAVDINTEEDLKVAEYIGKVIYGY
jgi:N-acylneuraminate cytidylyltransferase